MLKDSITERRRARHAEAQEDFTPREIVKLLFQDKSDCFYDFNIEVLDPTCGTGNIISFCLQRRLEYCYKESDIIKAVKSIYGTELYIDNVKECICVMKRLVEDHVKHNRIRTSPNFYKKLEYILEHNIVCTDYFKWDHKLWKPVA